MALAVAVGESQIALNAMHPLWETLLPSRSRTKIISHHITKCDNHHLSKSCGIKLSASETDIESYQPM